MDFNQLKSMNTIKRSLLRFTALATRRESVIGWLIFIFWLTSSDAVGQVVDIQLKPYLSTNQKIRVVRLQEIAEILTSNFRQRQTLSVLDIDDFPANQQSMEVSAEQVRFRLLLAGWKDTEFRILGERTLLERVAAEDLKQQIEQGILQDVLQTYQLQQDAVDIRLLSSIETTLQRLDFDFSTLSLSVSLPTQLPLGRRHLRVAFQDGGGKHYQTSLSIEITRYEEVVRLTSNVPAGTTLDESLLQRVRRPVNSNDVQFASFESVIGKEVQRDMKQFDLLQATAVQAPRTNQGRGHYDVRKNDLVSLIGRRGTLSVKLRGVRANQNGRIGEMIELIHPESKKLIYATLIDAQTAVID